MTDTVVVEGQWKSRWVALRKPSPVADCLCVLVYKERSKGKERSQLTLGDICGLELLQNFEGVNYALTLLCLTQSVTLGFDSRENLLAWDARIRYSLGEVHRFSVNVQPGTKLESGAASLHLCNNLIGIARDIPPVVLAHWKLTDLRRYGAVPNGFIFEGGTRCGYWTGVFFLACTEGEQISFLFDCIARGSSPSRTPFGLRPSLPDLSAHASSVEERITQEASELEKRLSMLSVCSHQSTASHSGSTGDTRSISSSSSEASHSDASLSSRLATWADPVRYPTPTEPSVSVSGATGSRSFSEEHHEGLLRTQSKPPRPRGLQEAGRQSSTDSGIATGSHSSYSGSFSSYTGSLDTAQGEAEEFGSVMSLTLTTNSSTNQTVSNTPTSTSNTNPRVPLQFQTSSILASTSTLIPGYRPCVCPISGVSQAQDLEYQVPVQLLQHYDTPRKLVQPHSSTSSSTQKAQCGLLEPLGSPASPTLNAPLRPSGSGDGVLPSGGLTMQRHILCPVCGGLKMVMPSTHIRSSHVPAGLEKNRPETSSAAVSAAPQGASADSSTEAELLSRYELISGQGSQKCLWEAEGRSSAVPTSPMSSLRLFRHSSLSDPRRSNDYMASPMEPFRNQSDLELCLTLSFGRSLALPGESGFTVTERLHGEPVNYVNIPVSPVSKRQLNYMELDLQDVQETGHTVRGVSNTKYAQIDHAATETAQRVGAQHAQGREERLHELEQRRRGTLN